jgi:hypothetical protein
MGNKCFAHSGAEVYKKIKYEQYHNETEMSKKYTINSKIYSKQKGLQTVEVFDKMFSKERIMKQVLLNQSMTWT